MTSLSSQKQAAIDARVRAAMVEFDAPGAALALVEGEHVVLTRGYGMAHLEHDVPVTPDTLFEIASITKLFTATAIMQLVEAEKLALDASIATYLPDLPAAWHPVTLRHILAHQSGLTSYTNVDAYWETTRLDIGPDAILDLVRELPLNFEPGARQSYDNTGYYLLGLALEAVTGRSYADQLRHTIFDPLNMQRTCANDPYAVIAGRARGHTLNDDGQIRNAAYYSNSGTYAGGVLLSSANDMARWAAALYSDTLLTSASRALMWTPHPSAAGNELDNQFVMGLGWFMVSHSKGDFVGHNGSIVGFASALIHDRERRRTLMLCVNQDQFERPHELLLDIAQLWRE